MMVFYVYLLECNDGSLYCGYTTNLKRRVDEHNHSKKGAKYTHNHRPVQLVYSRMFCKLSNALEFEYQVKQMTRPEKIDLILSSKALTLAN